MKIDAIDNGKEFDWGRTSCDYATYRDIYPSSFYEKLHALAIGVEGQKILDLGTGTGVLPRNMYKYGAKYVGTDISPEQINQARELSKAKGMEIDWKECQAEEVGYGDSQFDVITAVQCWQYFNCSILIPEIMRMLKPNGHLAILYMTWLTFEDEIAKKSEELVLKYNPDWKGANNKRDEFTMPDWGKGKFSVSTFHAYDELIPFTREAWNGRMLACRGIGASLPDDLVKDFSIEHLKLLKAIAPEEFTVLHEITFRIFRVLK
jgi:SAM-dependent methyltransferase